MGKSPLCEAAYHGRVDELKKLIAAGAKLDGSDGEIWNDTSDGMATGKPYYSPLGEAARSGNVACVRALLEAGADIDGVQYRNETALILAVGQEDGAKCVPVLVEAGANVHLVGVFGTALAYVHSTADGVAIVRTLLDAGARLDVTDAFGESTLDRVLRDLPKGPIKDKFDRERLPKLRAVVAALAEKAPPELAARIAAYLAALDAKLGGATKKASSEQAAFDALGSAKAVAKADWPQRVRAYLATFDKNREAVQQICARVLVTPAAIAHAEWPTLVEETISLSRTYGDMTEAMYGQRMGTDAMEEDEGGTMDFYGDEHLYTFDWVLTLLATPAAIAHPRWADLVIALCATKDAAVSYYSFGDDEISTLLTAPAVAAHPRFAELVGAGTKAFPFASCFGAGGALRKTKGTTPTQWTPLARKKKTAAASKKATPKKAAPKKAAPNKAVPKKTAPKKAAPKKKAVMKKAPMKKAAPKKRR